MKSSTQKKICLSVGVGLGAFGASPVYADTVTNENNDIILNVNQDNGFIGSVIINDTGAGGASPGQWIFDAETGFSSRPSLAAGTSTLSHTATGGVNVTGTGAAADIKSSSGTNHTTINHAKASGNHTVGANNNAWFFDETGSEETTTDTATSEYTDTHQTATNKQTQVVSTPAKYTSTNQTSTSLYDELMDGTNHHTSTRTAVGRTDTVTDSGANTTTLTQNNTDINLSTGTGAGSATMGVKRSGGAGNTTAEVLVTNGAGNTHGLRVGESSTTLSGGTASTTLTLDDNGAKFNGAGGAPARVTGVADGVADFDAVNFRQLNSLDKKLTGKINETGAVAAAFAQLGQAQTPGKSTFGIAAGGQGGKAGVAVGFSHRPVTMKPVVIKASLGAAGSTVAGGVGATWEF